MIQYTRHVYTPNVILLSGDVHTGEILQGRWACEDEEKEEIGMGNEKMMKEELSALNRLYEFTSSGLSHTFSRGTRNRQAEGDPRYYCDPEEGTCPTSSGVVSPTPLLSLIHI